MRHYNLVVSWNEHLGLYSIDSYSSHPRRRFELRNCETGKYLLFKDANGYISPVHGVVDATVYSNESPLPSRDIKMVRDVLKQVIGHELYLKQRGGWMDYYDENAENLGIVANSEEELAIRLDLAGAPR